ncbi:hypothetical protein BN871_EQ_00100 [Paenibacillus sp. P22]|nr:hypothetical protein BN871_EQ_00100 [Paenibacillus sp. P22]
MSSPIFSQGSRKKKHPGIADQPGRVQGTKSVQANIFVKADEGKKQQQHVITLAPNDQQKQEQGSRQSSGNDALFHG